MNTDTTKAMQDALQTAVQRMNSSTGSESKLGGGGGGAGIDTFGALMTIVPKLLQGSEASSEMVEKLEGQKGELTTLREQVRILRKQCYRMTKSQEQLLARIDDIQREQTNVARALLDLGRQLARITIVEDAVVDEDEYEWDTPPAREAYRRADARVNGDGHKRPRGTSPENGSTSRAGRLR